MPAGLRTPPIFKPAGDNSVANAPRELKNGQEKPSWGIPARYTKPVYASTARGVLKLPLGSRRTPPEPEGSQ